MKKYPIKTVIALAIFCWLAAWIYQAHVNGLREQTAQCAQQICAGDKLPSYDTGKYQLFKVDGRFYIAPMEYGGGSGALNFFWPSRAPGQKGNLAPEFKPSTEKSISNFYDVGIEIFIRSPKSGIPSVPLSYRFIERAANSDWIESRSTIRAGLDKYQMKHVIGDDGYYIDDVAYYVATELHDFEALPPIATCSHHRPDDGGGAGFMWRGLWVGIRMNQRHCEDWPEIYQEIIRILPLVREAQ